MTHKTFRELTAHQNDLEKRLRPTVMEISKMTMEEVTFLQSKISQMMWLSMQQVEEQNSVNQNQQENEQESF